MFVTGVSNSQGCEEKVIFDSFSVAAGVFVGFENRRVYLRRFDVVFRFWEAVGSKYLLSGDIFRFCRPPRVM